MLEDFLLQVNKPGRYIGREWNLPKKDFKKAKIRFALSFPDLYEVGMSNLGVRILYNILNNIPEVSCERIFSVEDDLENILRRNQGQIFSLESRSELGDFDLLGFSLGSELVYTNVLRILELGAIPLSAASRDHTHPLIIGGGPCALNPEPLYEFFDLFVIGEAEGLILEIVEIYRKYQDKYKKAKISKEDLLYLFSQLPGVYVPSLYEVSFYPSGAIKEFRPKIKNLPTRIKKRFVKDLSVCHFYADWLIPYIQTIHDRITLEIMRGCPNTCRFCQARSQYYPLRTRNIKEILGLAQEIYKGTGYEEISLSGLSVSDYPQIKKLSYRLMDLFKEKGVGLSLPSVKAKAMLGDLSSLIATVRKTGLTFAPESGTERLRRIIAKDFSEEEFFAVLKEVYASGYQRVKLYFMIGLPLERNDDLEAIIDFAMRTSELKKKISGGSAQVNVSINTFIPKPHTPFQWCKMEDMDTVRTKQDYLKAKIRNRRIKFSFHNRQMSFLEGVLSRGDRRLSKVIEKAFRGGAKFDAWGNHFNFDIWLNAFRELNIDPNFYLKEKSTDEILPWDFIDVGITKQLLVSEFNKSIDIK